MRSLKVKLDPGAIQPTRAHSSDAGLDLYAREDTVIPVGGSAVFDTGVHVQLPLYEHVYFSDDLSVTVEYLPTVGMLKSKSGLNVKHGITSEGVIDYGYTGSIVAKLYNHSREDYEVRRGDKITQLVILPVLTPQFEVVSEFDETERGDKGFGSSGR